MRNDVILKVSDLFERQAHDLPKYNPATKPTQEEVVAALIAAAYGLCNSPETYSAFGTAAKAALLMMDRVNIPYDGHYIELETAFQRRHGRPSPTEEARLAERERAARILAAEDYDRFAATNGAPDYHQGVFLTNYPTKERYVDEWWEERYADAGC